MKLLNLASVDYWLAEYDKTTYKDGRATPKYKKPIRLSHNVKRVSGEAEYAMYGQRIQNMYKAVIDNTPENRALFKKFSLAYFDGVNPYRELEYGDKANFMVVDTPVYNISMHVYFERLPSE